MGGGEKSYLFGDAVGFAVAGEDRVCVGADSAFSLCTGYMDDI